MKILIADDDPLSRHLLEKTLLRAGYDVVAVQNGMAAAEQLCKEDGPAPGAAGLGDGGTGRPGGLPRSS